MEADNILEEQQSLNENYCQVVENVPICRGEIMTETVHNPEIIEEYPVITCNKDVQITEETVSTAEDELQNIQLTKCREYDALSITCRLRFEAELLAKTKAKEDVTTCTLQSHIQELQENQEQLNNEIVRLQAFKHRLQQELTVERFNRSHIEKQMVNTGKIVNMLQQNYDGLAKTYQSAWEDTNKLEQSNQNELEEYQERKQELLRAIKVETESLEKINSILEQEDRKYNVDLNTKNYTLAKLTEAEVNITNEIADTTKQCDNMKNQLNENNKILTEVLSQNQSLHNLINSINVDELEEQKAEKQRSYQTALNALEDDLNKVRESCNAAEAQKAAILKSLESEVKIGQELEAADDELENELGALIAAQEELNNIGRKIENKASNICSLESEVDAVDSKLIQLTDEINETTQNKKDAIDNLHIIRQKEQESRAKLTDLQNQTETFIKNYEQNATKLAELQQKEHDLHTEIGKVSSELLKVKEKYVDIEKLYSGQLEKATKEFSDAQISMEQVKLECNMKTKALSEDLLAYKADTEKTKNKNQEHNKHKLQEMEEQLNNVQCELKKESQNAEQLKISLKQKEIKRQKLQLEFELAKVNCHEFSQKSVSENIKPTGILKSPGKSAASKTVSWQVPRTISSDSEISQQSVHWKSQEDLFNQLLGMSPPESLEGSKPRKRSRID